MKTSANVIPADQIKILGQLGGGAFADVFLGEWRNQTVALKIINKTSTEDHEAEILPMLDHPNIIKLKGVTKTGASLFPTLVMEYVERGNLREFLIPNNLLLIKEKRMSFTEQIAEGLNYLHLQHVIHRDLKLENILLDKNWKIVITDFGMSVKHMGINYQSNKNAGSIQYIAPEALHQDSHGMITYTSAADLHALGVVIYALWFLSLPYSDVPNKILKQKRYGTHFDVGETDPYIISYLIRNLLSRVPGTRFSAEKVIKTLHPSTLDVCAEAMIRIISSFKTIHNEFFDMYMGSRRITHIYALSDFMHRLAQHNLLAPINIEITRDRIPDYLSHLRVLRDEPSEDKVTDYNDIEHVFNMLFTLLMKDRLNTKKNFPPTASLLCASTLSKAIKLESEDADTFRQSYEASFGKVEDVVWKKWIQPQEALTEPAKRASFMLLTAPSAKVTPLPNVEALNTSVPRKDNNKCYPKCKVM